MTVPARPQATGLTGELTTGRTPLTDEDSLSAIEHVNGGHVADLLHCVRAFTPVQDATHLQVTAVYTDGMQLDVTSPAGQSSHFVAYTAPGTTHTAMVATVQAAMKQLGVRPEQRVAQWTVQDNRALTAHFRRLTLHLGEDQRSDWQPGYACRFDVPGQEHGRPYTLRRVSGHTAEVDVYCHDGTLGSRWAQGLGPGDTVTARGGRQEGLPDFAAGPGLLLGDETALPTIAALLEGWAHEWPLRVLLEVGDAAEQRYLDDVALPRGVHLSWLPRTGESGAAIREVLDTLETPPAAVWCALEVDRAKDLRRHLKAEYPGADVRVTGYWRVNEVN